MRAIVWGVWSADLFVCVCVCVCVCVYACVHSGGAIRGASSRCEAEHCESSTGLCCHLGLSRSSHLLSASHDRDDALLLPFKSDDLNFEWKMWHLIIIYVYVSAIGPASLREASGGNKPGLLPSLSFPRVPRGNWWRHPTMPEPISPCELVAGRASASPLSTKQTSLAGAADA